MQLIWKRLTQPLVQFFVAGFLALLPLVITVAVVLWVGNLLVEQLGPEAPVGGLLTNLGLRFHRDSPVPYLMGWILVLAIVFALGIIVQLGAKTIIKQAIENLFAGIPLIGNIYTTSQKFVELMETKHTGALQGMSAVFCFFGQEKTTGFLAFLVSPERFVVNDKQYLIVMIPTAPVPFGGAMLFVPVDQVQPADMPVESMMSIYLSMGVNAPSHLQTAATGQPT